MFDALKSEPTRWAIGTLITLVLGLSVGFGPYFLSRSRKNLWYQTSIYPLVRVGTDERVEVLFDGESVPNAYVSILTLHYRGNNSIVEEDYRTPVTFDFENARVLNAELIGTQPKGINATFAIKDDSKVIFEPIALNDRNQITARVLVTERKVPTISGHILGVPAIKDRNQEWGTRRILQAICLGIVILGTVIAFISGFTDPPLPERPPLTPLMVVAITLIIAGNTGTMAIVVPIFWARFWARRRASHRAPH